MVNIILYSEDIIMNFGIAFSFVLFSFISFLLITMIIYLFKKRKKYETYTPNLSIIIPAYNEEKNIKNCIESVINSKYDEKLIEIIIVDDKSTDNTSKIVKKIINNNPNINIKLVYGEHKGKAQALNIGVKHSKENIIMCLDADVIVEKNTIQKLISPLKKEIVGATNAVVLIKKPKKMIEHFQYIEYYMNSLIRISFANVYKNSIWFFGAIACYKKEVLDKVGGFKNDTLTEDMDICLEIYKNNYKIITVKDAQVKTDAMKNAIELKKQRMRWYYGALQALWKNKELIKNKKSPEVLFLYINQYWWTIFSFLFFPITSYQVYYWLPTATQEIVWYIFRWFSLSGPFYVLYMIPEWGLSTLNIFGVMSGIITFFIAITAMIIFKARIYIKTLIALFFYFPYTILLNLIIIIGVIKYSFSKKKYFVKE
jgi:peptidoglycan-N-acetylglucosamine deacetylase